jgi:hypothetical protein
METEKRGIRELYANNPRRADWLVFGRRTDPLTRRGFLSGLDTMSAVLGAEVVFGRFMPAGLIPAALAEEMSEFTIEGKHPGLVILNDRPVNAETPAYLLDHHITPADRLFVRNNGMPPVDINPDKVPISRGVPIAKAMEEETLIAWQINGKDLPVMNGYPLRLVVGGWPASTSGKWLKRISVRNKEHDGPKMGGFSYRVPCKPVVPGAQVSEQDKCIIESMPVKSLITYPRSGVVEKLGPPFEVRGHAWAGDLGITAVDVSIDFGQAYCPESL